MLKTLKDENNALFANHHERSEVLRETPVIKIIYLNYNFDTVSVTETNNEGLLIVMMISFNVYSIKTDVSFFDKSDDCDCDDCDDYRASLTRV